MKSLDTSNYFQNWNDKFLNYAFNNEEKFKTKLFNNCAEILTSHNIIAVSLNQHSIFNTLWCLFVTDEIKKMDFKIDIARLKKDIGDSTKNIF